MEACAIVVVYTLKIVPCWEIGSGGVSSVSGIANKAQYEGVGGGGGGGGGGEGEIEDAEEVGRGMVDSYT